MIEIKKIKNGYLLKNKGLSFVIACPTKQSQLTVLLY